MPLPQELWERLRAMPGEAWTGKVIIKMKEGRVVEWYLIERSGLDTQTRDQVTSR